MTLDLAVSLIRGRNPEAAVPILSDIVASATPDLEPRYWLASALLGSGRLAEHRLALTDARNLHALRILEHNGVDIPKLKQDRVYAFETGNLFYSANVMSAATLAYSFAIDLDDPKVGPLIQYGLSLQHQGRVPEALDVFRLCGDLFDDPNISQFLLFPTFHAPGRGELVKRQTSDWARRTAGILKARPFSLGNSRETDRKIRIGYVAPAISGIQLAQFFLPVLEAHDQDKFEIFVYVQGINSDSNTINHVNMIDCSQFDSFEMAERINKDKIDIIIELWGHTAGSRIEALLFKPAPIQCQWINFVFTTGIREVDFVLHPDGLVSGEEQDLYVEKIWEIGPITAPFRPLPARPEVATTPALQKGYVTYGCFNNPIKLSDETIAAWSAILFERPADRLVLKYKYFEDPALRRATQARFAAFGVDPGQLEFRAHSTGPQYLQEFQDIDLALDPSPCPGGTTSLDAISNGVPVLTLRGADFYARIGIYAVLPCGLPELVADSWPDYVVRALELTSDYQALDALRQRVRPGFEASPYRDEAGFTRRLEAEYRRMFEQWANAASG